MLLVLRAERTFLFSRGYNIKLKRGKGSRVTEMASR